MTVVNCQHFLLEVNASCMRSLLNRAADDDSIAGVRLTDLFNNCTLLCVQLKWF